MRQQRHYVRWKANFLCELEKGGHLQKAGTREAGTEYRLIGSLRGGTLVQLVEQALWKAIFPADALAQVVEFCRPSFQG